MSIEAKGRPWDQETFKRIERKGGCHFRSTCSDYIELERKIEAHELRYADRVEVYGEHTYGEQRITMTDTVVVLNGGLYMSTGIEDDEDVTDVNPNRPPEQPVDYELQRMAIQFQTLADKYRREVRIWAAVASTCLLLVLGVLFIPTEWVYYLVEAFR